MRQTVHGGQHHTEAVEQGHTDAEFVVLGESHVLAREVAVVGYAEVGQHDAFGESCGATGVLHIADIVARNVLLHGFQCLVLHVLAQEQQFGGVEHTTILLHTDVNDVLQEGESLAVQMTAFAGL